MTPGQAVVLIFDTPPGNHMQRWLVNALGPFETAEEAEAFTRAMRREPRESVWVATMQHPTDREAAGDGAAAGSS